MKRKHDGWVIKKGDKIYPKTFQITRDTCAWFASDYFMKLNGCCNVELLRDKGYEVVRCRIVEVKP